MTAQTELGWIPEDTLADRLVRVRRQLGLSQREAAVKTGISYGSWQSMEDGRQARGLDQKVAQISAALGVNRNWLMWGSSDPAPGPTPFVTVGYPDMWDAQESHPSSLHLVPSAA